MTDFIFAVEALGSVLVLFLTAAYVKARQQPGKGKAGTQRVPESRLAILAVLGFPVGGLLAAFLLTSRRSTDPLEIAEVFCHCIAMSVLAGLMSGVVIQAAASSRIPEGIWDREIDGPSTA